MSERKLSDLADLELAHQRVDECQIVPGGGALTSPTPSLFASEIGTVSFSPWTSTERSTRLNCLDSSTFTQY